MEKAKSDGEWGGRTHRGQVGERAKSLVSGTERQRRKAGVCLGDLGLRR